MNASPHGRPFRHTVIAGLEVAVGGALAALGLLVVLSRLSGLPWYAYGNLLSTSVYPLTVLETPPGYHTLAGFALGFLYFVAAGLLFSLVFPIRRGGAGPYLLGVFFSLVLFMLGDRYWWQSWVTYVVVYGVHSHLMWSHVAFGVVLGTIVRRRARLEERSLMIEDAELPSNWA
jgi:hypothetical protein